MLKFLCLFFIFADIVNGGKITVKYNSFKVYSVMKNNSYVDIYETGRKTHIVWKTDVCQTSPTLRATMVINYRKTNTTQYAKIDDLCKVYQQNSLEADVQKFILEVIANVEKCPILKGTSSVIRKPFYYSYDIENPICGKVSSEVRVLKQMEDSSDIHPLINGVFVGNITGCA